MIHEVFPTTSITFLTSFPPITRINYLCQELNQTPNTDIYSGQITFAFQGSPDELQAWFHLQEALDLDFTPESKMCYSKNDISSTVQDHFICKDFKNHKIKYLRNV